MDDARFWELVDLLGGVADDASVPRLEAGLRAGEAEPFLDHVYERVAALLQECRVPASHSGDTAEWLAAAVVASGRESYERTRDAGGELAPDDWAWGEAEALLVAGVEEHDEDAERERADDEDFAELLGDKLGLSLRWCAPEPPAGVETTWEARHDPGDDPDASPVGTEDEEWTATLAVLDGDPEFHHRRTSLSAVGLHVVVRDVEEAVLMAWPSDDDVRDVVLTVPVEVVLAAPSRHEAYLEAVVTLVTAVGEALATPS